MKKTLFFLLAYVLIVLNVGAQVLSHDITDTKSGKNANSKFQETKKGPIKITLSAKPYRPKKDCKRGLGICDITISVTPGYVAAIGTLLDNNNLQLQFQSDLHPFFSVDEDLTAVQIDPDEVISLSSDVARQFGKSSITLLPGMFTVDYGASKYGTVTLQTTTTE